VGDQFVYILTTGSRTYVGYTTNPIRRLLQHNGFISGGAATTRHQAGKWKIALIVSGFKTKGAALKYEAALKHPQKCQWLRPYFEKRNWKTTKRIGLTNKTKWAFRIAEATRTKGDSITIHLLHDRLDNTHTDSIRTTQGPLRFTIARGGNPDNKTNDPRTPTRPNRLLQECKHRLHTLRLSMETKEGGTRFSSFYPQLIDALDLLHREPEPPRSLGKKGAYAHGMKHLRSMHRSLGLSRRKARKLPSFRKDIRRKLASLRLLRQQNIEAKLAEKKNIARRLYWTSRKRLHRLLDTGQTKRASFEGGVEALLAHHIKEAKSHLADNAHNDWNTHMPWDALTASRSAFDPSRTEDTNLMKSLSPSCVEKLLYSTRNSSPGDDRVTIANLRKLAPKVLSPGRKEGEHSDLCVILSLIFSECLSSATSIKDWKSASAILLLKPGRDPDAVRSWRHVVLTSVIYRLYTSELAKRLTGFALVKGRLSRLQHGFIPNIGAQYHVHTLLSMMEEGKLHAQDLYLTFIDLTNAFGTIPVQGILRSLRMIGCPESFVEVAKDLYDNISMWFRLRAQEKLDDNSIPLERGVRQGCPLSPVIFIIAFNPLLLWLENAHVPSNDRPPSLGFCPADDGPRTPHLAFCDDIVLTSKNLSSAQESLRRVRVFCDSMGISINQGKCGTIILQEGRHKNTHLKYNHKPFPIIHPLGDETYYKYLGYRISAETDWETMAALFSKEASRRSELIHTSGLLPIQKVRTLECWASPVPSHCLANMRPSEKWLVSFTKNAISAARRFISHDGTPLLAGIPGLQFTSTIAEGGLGISDLKMKFCRTRILLATCLLSPNNQDDPLKIAKWYAQRGWDRARHRALLPLYTIGPDEDFWSGLAWSLQQMGLRIREEATGWTVASTLNTWSPQSTPGTPRKRRHLIKHLHARVSGLPCDTTSIFIAYAKQTRSNTDKAEDIGLATNIILNGKLTSLSMCRPKVTNTHALLLALDLALDALEMANVPKNSRLALFVPSRYTLRTLSGTLPTQQAHDLTLSVATRIKGYPRSQMFWVPSQARCFIRSKCVRLARKALRKKWTTPQMLSSDIPGRWPKDPFSPKGIAMVPPRPNIAMGPTTYQETVTFLKETAACLRQRAWLGLKGRKHLLSPMEARASYSHLKNAGLTVSELRMNLLAKFGNLTRRKNACKFGCRQPAYQSHILGGCTRHHGLYTLRHDKVVVSLYEYLHKAMPDCEIVVSGTKKPKGCSTQIPPRAFGRTTQKRLGAIQEWKLEPDLVILDHMRMEVTVIEVGVANASLIPQLTMSKPLKYKRLETAINKGRTYSCNLNGIILGNLGKIPAHAVEVLSKRSKTSTRDSIRCLQRISNQIVRDGMYLFRTFQED